MQICGRDISDGELEWIRSRIGEKVSRTELSRLFCSHTGWVKSNGGLKDMSCRTALLKLEQKGLIELPRPRHRVALPKVKKTPQGEPCLPVELKAGDIEIGLKTVERKESSLWNELIDRYHYLGYNRLAGAQMRFYVLVGPCLIPYCCRSISGRAPRALWLPGPSSKTASRRNERPPSRLLDGQLRWPCSRTYTGISDLA